MILYWNVVFWNGKLLKIYAYMFEMAFLGVFVAFIRDCRFMFSIWINFFELVWVEKPIFFGIEDWELIVSRKKGFTLWCDSTDRKFDQFIRSSTTDRNFIRSNPHSFTTMDNPKCRFNDVGKSNFFAKSLMTNDRYKIHKKLFAILLSKIETNLL